MALAVVASVAVPCGCGLVAFRWWLDAKPKTETGGLGDRVRQLEEWRQRAELGKLGR
jgi:hypothetical protein